MQIAVIGSGMVGSLIATELAKEYQITVFDYSEKNLKELGGENPNIRLEVIDVNDIAFEEKINNYKLAINCLPGFMGFNVLKKMINLGISCIDISFMPEDCLQLNELARKNECTIIPDAGVAPGLSNLIIGNIVANNSITEIRTMVGGLPKEKKPPWNYKAPFSPIDVIEEYTRPARVKIDGKIEIREALSDIQNFEVEGIGKLEAFLTDGLRTLLNSDKKISEIPNLLEYTIRYPGHAELVKELISNGGFSDEIVNFNGGKITKKERTSQKLFDEWKLSENEEEFTFMIISAVKNDGSEINYTVYDERTEGWSSMARTTGLTACAFAKLIIEKKVTKTGILCPETLGQDKSNYDFVIDYLKKRKVSITYN
jgi:lysine 6-dehydrogenase